MNRVQALAVVGLLAALSAAGLLLGPALVALQAVASIVVLRRGRVGFLLFAASTVLVNAALFAWLAPGEVTLSVAGVDLGISGARIGIIGALRLVAVTGANLALLAWVGAERLLDGLRLPAVATAFLGAVILLAHDLGRDFSRLLSARRLEGAWPSTFGGRVRAGVRLLPPLLVSATRRAVIRRDALRLAGHDTPASFAPLVAVTALGAAGRLALLGLPNVALTYVVVFLGGLLYGPRIGALAGFLSMALTDLMLTGLLPAPFANAPAMALVGALGGWMRGLDFAGDRATEAWAGRLFAFAAGLAGTMVFSVVSDTLTWLIVAEYRETAGAFRLLVLAGLAFNALPALVNGVLFAAAAGPVSRAFHAIERSSPQPVPGSAMRTLYP